MKVHKEMVPMDVDPRDDGTVPVDLNELKKELSELNGSMATFGIKSLTQLYVQVESLIAVTKLLNKARKNDSSPDDIDDYKKNLSHRKGAVDE